MSEAKPARRYTRDNWPIAAAMIQYPNILPDGSSVQDQPAKAWVATLAEVTDIGFTELDPTDSWLRLADLEPCRLDEFMAVLREAGLTILAISTARRSPIDPVHGDAYLAYGHKVIDTVVEVGAVAVSFGFLEALNDAQKKALWFWTAQGPVNPDDRAVWQKAVDRIRELASHDADLGLEIGLEMYEDTDLGTADSAVRFTTDVDRPNVGINADLGNVVRLHRPVEHWLSMMRKVAPHARYWHAKNYFRTGDETTGLVVTAPAPLELGVISYRVAIKMALEHGFDVPFLYEHYGGDGLSVSALNHDHIRRVLPR
jgi:sugar phosphate isomerase/epimerase